jgi:PASTA domain
MTDPRSDALVQEYLRRLDQQLTTLPKERRAALREQIESHIRDARAEILDDDPDSVAEVLEHLGDPSDIAADGAVASPTGRRRRASTWAAIGLVGVVALAALFIAVGRSSGTPSRTPPHLVAPTSYKVPVLAGLPLDTAMTQLSDNSMLATCKPTPGLRKSAFVTAQAPAPTSKVKPGSVVSLTVVRGSSTHVSTLGVPATIGFQVSCAKLLLAGDHVPYRVQWVSAPTWFPPGTVISQVELPSGQWLLRVAHARSFATVSSTLPPCTHFQPWAFEGATILAQKSARGGGFGGPDGGIWTYGSMPQNLHGNGTYVFYFGPVPSDFGWGKSPDGFAVQWPPDFTAGGFLRPTGKIGVVTLHGQRYFRVSESIVRYGTTCSNLVLWVY